MSEPEHNPTMNAPRRAGRRILRSFLVGGSILWLMFGPFGPVSYVGGLFNSIGTWMLLSPIMMLLVPVAGIALPLSIAQGIRRWHGPSLSERRRSAFMIVAWGGLVFPTILGFAGFDSGPFDMYVRGFTRYARREADVEAIRSWLSTLDSSDYTDDRGTIVEKRFTQSEQAPCIARLRPKWATVLPDDAGRLMVRVLWGGGMIGHWGIVVGPEDMPMPSSDRYDRRFHLAAGAYVWSGE